MQLDGRRHLATARPVVDRCGLVVRRVVHAELPPVVPVHEGQAERLADAHAVVRRELVVVAREQPRDAARLAGGLVRVEQGDRVPVERRVALRAEDGVHLGRLRGLHRWRWRHVTNPLPSLGRLSADAFPRYHGSAPNPLPINRASFMCLSFSHAEERAFSKRLHDDYRRLNACACHLAVQQPHVLSPW